MRRSRLKCRPVDAGVYRRPLRKPIPVDVDIYFLLSPKGVADQGTIVKGDYFIQIGHGLYQSGITFPAIASADVGISFSLRDPAFVNGVVSEGVCHIPAAD
jgi:hypothetical protein